MPQLGTVSKQRLATCAQDLQTLVNEIVKYYDVTVVCGERGEADQNKAYAEGKSTVKYPNSKHNTSPSLAVDIASWEVDHIDWTLRQALYLAGYIRATADRLFAEGRIKHRVRIGADWNGNNDIDDSSFMDAPHVELIIP